MNEKKVRIEQVEHLIPLKSLHHKQLSALLEQAERLHLFEGQDFLREIDNKYYYYLIHGSVKKVDADQEQIINCEGESAQWSLFTADSLPREAVALSDACLIKIEIALLEKLLCWHHVVLCLLSEMAVLPQYAEDYFWIKKLLRSRLFFKVPPISIQKIIKQFSECQMDAGSYVIEQGAEGASCYLLRKGSAVVERDGEVIAELHVGDVFGEDALVNNKPRNASVRLLDDSELLELHKKDFFELMIQPAVNLVSEPIANGLVAEGAQFIDVRTKEEFEKEHKSGALHIPLNLMWLKAEVLKPERIYITYSSTPERAKAAAHLLNEKGFKAYALQ